MNKLNGINMNIIATEQLEPEKPCWCGYSSDIEPSGCKGSNMVIDIDENGNRKAVRCKGFAKNVNNQELKKLIENIPDRYNLKNHKHRDGQAELYKMINSKTGQGAWVSGSSGIGKTHLTYLALIEYLRKSNNAQRFVQVNAVDLITAWMNKFNDDVKKYNQSLDLLTSVENATLIYIDDIDKIGNITETRGAEFFALFNDMAKNKKTLFVTSQKTILEFCKLIPSELSELNNNGTSPIMTRLNELCRPAQILKQSTF